MGSPHSLLIAVAMSWFIVEFVLILLSVFFTVASNIPNQARIMCARLLTVTPRPYRQHLGLGRADLSNLRRIAAVGLTATESRGNVVTILLLILGFTGIGAFVRGLVQMASYITFFRAMWQQLPLVTAPLTTIMILLVTLFMRFVRCFLDEAYGNRVVALACEEALVLLDAFEMPNALLNTNQKRSLAFRLDLQLTTRLVAGAADSIVGKEEDPETGETWYLLTKKSPGWTNRLLRAFTDEVRQWRWIWQRSNHQDPHKDPSDS